MAGKDRLFSHPTPFTPPTMEDLLSCLRLARSSRIGPVTYHRLIAEHGSAAAALARLPELAEHAGVRGYAPCPATVAQAEYDRGHRLGARLLVHGGAEYPASLLQLPDAPPVLWALGATDLLSRPQAALVGARNASSLGLRMARRLAQGLGERGVVVVSGLARGIDGAAHGAALASGTIAVLAGGIDRPTPTEHRTLADDIARQGLCLAEAPPGTEAQARHFPQRNRIIAGLALATVVVEAATRSGSLLTARNALDYGREVLAVPGHPLDPRAAGCNMLLRDGATLVRHAEDVLEAMGEDPVPRAAPPVRKARPSPAATAPEAAQDAARVLLALGPSPISEEALAEDLRLDGARLARAVLSLELEGRLQRHPGGLLSRA